MEYFRTHGNRNTTHTSEARFNVGRRGVRDSVGGLGMVRVRCSLTDAVQDFRVRRRKGSYLPPGYLAQSAGRKVRLTFPAYFAKLAQLPLTS